MAIDNGWRDAPWVWTPGEWDEKWCRGIAKTVSLVIAVDPSALRATTVLINAALTHLHRNGQVSRSTTDRELWSITDLGRQAYQASA